MIRLIVARIRGALAEGRPAEAAYHFRNIRFGDDPRLEYEVMDGLSNAEIDILIAWCEAFADGLTSHRLH